MRLKRLTDCFSDWLVAFTSQSEKQKAGQSKGFKHFAQMLFSHPASPQESEAHGLSWMLQKNFTHTGHSAAKSRKKRLSCRLYNLLFACIAKPPWKCVTLTALLVGSQLSDMLLWHFEQQKNLWAFPLKMVYCCWVNINSDKESLAVSHWHLVFIKQTLFHAHVFIWMHSRTYDWCTGTLWQETRNEIIIYVIYGICVRF